MSVMNEIIAPPTFMLPPTYTSPSLYIVLATYVQSFSTLNSFFYSKVGLIVPNVNSPFIPFVPVSFIAKVTLSGLSSK